MSTTTQATILAELQAVIKGLQAKFPNGQFTLGNTVFTTAALVGLFQGLVDALNVVIAAEASATVAHANARAKALAVKPTFTALKKNLRNTFGQAADELAVFGLEPEKVPAPRTAKQHVAAAAKAAATRKARGTKGKKQKLEVQGDVTGVQVVPVTATTPAEPAAAQPQQQAVTPAKP